MKRQINFPSIEAFRSVVKQVTDRATYAGKNEQGYALFDETLPKPVLTFTGSVKLHGSNGGVCYNNIDGLWVQSREHIISPEKDNAGFAMFVHARRDTFIRLAQLIAKENKIDLDESTVSIYGEWAGKGIQKGVGIAQVEKAFFIFGIKVSPTVVVIDEETGNPKDLAYWVSHKGYNATSERIFNVLDYQTYSITVDFNKPSTATDELNALTLSVEAQCPISSAFGVEGIGEGIVFSTIWEGSKYTFKSKGEKHSVSAPKVKNDVDVERVESIKAFAEYAVTSARVEQASKAVFGDESPDIKKLGEVIKWVNVDIVKEELDTLAASGFTSKDVSGALATRTKALFSELLDSSM